MRDPGPTVDAAIVVALIALVGAFANVGLTYALNSRSERRRALEKEDSAWARQVASLGFAAQELADRLHNILEGYLLDAYGRGDDSVRMEEAIQSTLFRICQYFGWSEVGRRAARGGNPRHAVEAQTLERLRGEVARTFASDQYGPGEFMIWRESQRAIGELMLTHEEHVVDTLGVAGFVTNLKKLEPWIHRMEGLMKAVPASEWPGRERDRLRDVRSGLEALAAEANRSRR